VNNHLRSRGFNTVYFPAKEVYDAFAQVGIDASSDERTSETECEVKISSWNALPSGSTEVIRDTLLSAEQEQVGQFVAALNGSLSRNVIGVTITALYVKSYDLVQASSAPVSKFEVDIRYSNGDVIHGSFQEADDAIDFLQSFF
jgi:hypothetical protein